MACFDIEKVWSACVTINIVRCFHTSCGMNVYFYCEYIYMNISSTVRKEQRSARCIWSVLRVYMNILLHMAGKYTPARGHGVFKFVVRINSHTLSSECLVSLTIIMKCAQRGYVFFASPRVFSKRYNDCFAYVLFSGCTVQWIEKSILH